MSRSHPIGVGSTTRWGGGLRGGSYATVSLFHPQLTATLLFLEEHRASFAAGRLRSRE